MKEVYILTVINESESEGTICSPEISVFGNLDAALKAFDVAVNEARAEAEDFEFPHEDSEVSTFAYRYFRIEDLQGENCITIEVQARELIESTSDDLDVAL